MATESPIITPFPGAKLYRLTATQLEFLSVRQNVLKKKGNGKNIIVIGAKRQLHYSVELYS